MGVYEFVIISGKGGTGKTTFVSSLIPYLDDLVIADCDVDAPDLDILIQSTLKREEDFFGLEKATIDQSKCIQCGKCINSCNFSAINKNIEINLLKCEGCSVCTVVCPTNAIQMIKSKTGTFYQSTSKYGEVFHAKLIPGEEASGKLVSKIRKEAKYFTKNNSKKYIIIDGSPGIACNVISSIIGTKKAIVVVEPTISGVHDLKRVYELLSKYPIESFVVINKYNLSLKKTKEIESFCKENNISVGLKIPFDKRIVQAIVEKKIPSIKEKEFFENIGFFEFLEKLKNN